jgi:hypothetical protein
MGMLRVRSRVIGGWLLGAGVLATAVVGACADKKGALMLAITTDMKAPKDVNAVAVSITTNGLVKASFIGRVTPQGDILLPGTLAIVEPDDKNAVIRIRVMAFQNQKPRVIRDVRTTAPPDGRTALLRIPLNFVNDGKVAGNELPTGLVPDPVPGTEGLSPSAGATSSTSSGTDAGAGAVGTKDLSPSGGDFDFMLNFQPKDCLNPQDETIINGECHDSYIDPASLPDFDAAELGDSTGQTGSCFDLAKCFAGAVGTGQASGSDGGTASDAGAGGSDSGTAVPDAGPKPFKDFRPAAVAFDKTTCTIQLNGADPARLNIAIVTPDTGECVRAGECYVPIDRGAAGWQDDGAGRVQLPSYLCKFLDAKGLRLATSSDVCAAKLESNPICTPKAGDDAGIFPVADGGGDGGADTFAIPEDFASAVAISGPILYFASQSRQGFVNLLDPAAKPSPIGNIATAGSAQLPWRFGVGPGGVALANGSTTGYVIDPAGAATPFQFPSNIVDVAALDARFTWGTTQGQSMPSFYIAPPLPVFTAEVQAPGLTALAPTPFKDHVLYGTTTGAVGLVQPQFMALGEPSAAAGARVDGIVLTGGSLTSANGYALMANGLYTVTANGTNGLTSTAPLVSDASAFAGIQTGAIYFPRTLAPAPSCLVFSTSKGLEYIVEKGGVVASKGVLVAAAAQQPILGVAVGPDPARGGFAAYYTVFAQRNPSGGGAGGGIYRTALPPQCVAAGGSDGGTTAPDSGADAAPPPCSPASCPNGCCSLVLGCQAGIDDKACGNFGNACQDCTAFASTCGVAAKMCN